MDFCEGFFLGAIWTDTDYQNQKHYGFYLSLSLVVCALVSYLLVFPASYASLVFIPFKTSLILGSILLLALPFAAHFYHRLHLSLRIAILIAYAFQYYLFINALVAYVCSKVKINWADLPKFFLDLVNTNILKANELLGFLGKLLATIVSVVAGGIIVAFYVIAAIILAVLIPIVLVLLVKGLQRLVDYLVKNYLVTRLFG